MQQLGGSLDAVFLQVGAADRRRRRTAGRLRPHFLGRAAHIWTLDASCPRVHSVLYDLQPLLPACRSNHPALAWLWIAPAPATQDVGPA